MALASNHVQRHYDNTSICTLQPITTEGRQIKALRAHTCSSQSKYPFRRWSLLVPDIPHRHCLMPLTTTDEELFLTDQVDFEPAAPVAQRSRGRAPC